MAWGRERPGIVLVREPNSPRETAGVSIAASVQEAADPADSITQSERRSRDIGELQEWQLMPAAIPPEEGYAGQDSAKDRDATGPDAENVQWVVTEFLCV